MRSEREQPRKDPQWVAARFDRIASSYRFFEKLFLIPRRLRPLSMEWLCLRPGDRVLSVGCGQGPSLPFLAEAVGPSGHVVGVDLSKNMLQRAKLRVDRLHLANVELLHLDVNDYVPPVPFDAVLFSFSLTTFGDPSRVLRHVLEFIRPGGHLVIMDAQVPPGFLGTLIGPFLPVARRFLEATVLGDPDMRPLDELRALGEPVEVVTMRGGAYFLARVVKPDRALSTHG